MRRSGLALERKAPRLAAAAAAAVLFVALATGSALDRASARYESLSGRVPSVFATQALLTKGRLALAAGDTVQAEKLGIQAVERAPVDPGSSALLGAAWLAMNRQRDAEKAFRVAGQLGWRIAFTQAYWLDRALRVPDYRLAALRIDALLRQNPDLVSQRVLLDPVERNPQGRAALIDRMMARPNWLLAYTRLIENTQLDVMQQRAVVLQEAGQRGLRLGCDAVAPASARLLSLGAAAESAALFRAQCPLATGVLTDGNLAAIGPEPPAVPLMWNLIGDADVSAGLEPSPTGSGQRLRIASSSQRTKSVLTQTIVAAPGRYRLSWASGSESNAPKAGIVAALTCAEAPNGFAHGNFDAASQRWELDLTINFACPAHRLFLGVAPDAGNMWLERIRLDPLR